MIKDKIRLLILKVISAALNVKASRYAYYEIVKVAMNLSKNVEHNNCKLKFTVPNVLNYFRANSFSIKEPETLDWIDSMEENSILWDIGANVGLYGIYAAKKRSCIVYAFEPSVFNLELLARNIFINNLSEKITIIPLPLSDALTVSLLNMSSTDWGGALSTFDQAYGHNGKELKKIFQFRTIGVSMKDAVDLLNIPKPDYIKMDVDGIEHLILKGGVGILMSTKSILVEVNDEYEYQKTNVHEILTKSGFVMKEKKHSDLISFGKEFNQPEFK